MGSSVRIGLLFVWAASLLQHVLQAGLLGIDSYEGFVYLILAVFILMVMSFELFLIDHALVVCCNIILQHLLGTSLQIFGRRDSGCGLQGFERVLCFLALTVYMLLKGVRGKALHGVVAASGLLTMIAIALALTRTCGQSWYPSGLEDINMLLSWGFTAGVNGAAYHRHREEAEDAPPRLPRICPGMPSPDVVGGGVQYRSASGLLEANPYVVGPEVSAGSTNSPGHAESEEKWPKLNFRADDSRAQSTESKDAPPPQRHDPPLRTNCSGGAVNSFDSVIAVASDNCVQQPTPLTEGARSVSGERARELDNLYDDMATTQVLEQIEHEVEGKVPAEVEEEEEDDDILS